MVAHTSISFQAAYTFKFMWRFSIGLHVPVYDQRIELRSLEIWKSLDTCFFLHG